MAEADFVEGKLWGTDRDPSLEWKDIRGLDDLRLGKLVRALAKTASSYRETERAEHCPPELPIIGRTAEEYAHNVLQRDKFHTHMRMVDGFIGGVITGLIDYSDINPQALAMYSKSAIFKDGEPALYWEHWGTDDLDDPGRDSVELQMFVALNDYLKTEAGRLVAHDVLDFVLEETQMSARYVPTRMTTFDTVPEEMFAPFVKATASTST